MRVTRYRSLGLALTIAVASAALGGAIPGGRSIVAAAMPCENLKGLQLPDTTITSAEVVAAGAFALPEPGTGRGAADEAAAVKSLPAFCRVAATLKPSTDSDIKIEVWLPTSNWNRKFEAVGNGGWRGSVSYTSLTTGKQAASMVDALKRGYVTASTDTGHAGGSASFAQGHPEKVIDFAYRSEHEMTVKAKAIVNAFYGGPAQFSYWNGCSAGGRQALKEAQKYPDDFNGIVAGSPGADWTGRAAAALRVAQALHKDDASDIPPEKYRAVHAAVLAACDALDGAKDGLLENPKRCAFDPKVLQCKDADAASCLTPAQVEAARQIYSSITEPKSKRAIGGLEPGSELGWATWGGPQPLGIALDHFRFLVFNDPNWDYTTFDFNRDLARADEIDRAAINALDPNLKPFFDRGGKLIQFHGWSDPQISPESSVAYYNSVARRMGGTAVLQPSYRLFMAPGMAHCGGGEGPNSFDALSALEEWVERGKAPDQIVASHSTNGAVDRTRPLCPYPQVAHYNGSGSLDDAGSFACAADSSGSSHPPTESGATR